MMRSYTSWLVLLALVASAQEQVGLVNRVVAVVNDEVITLSELEREVALLLQDRPLSVEELDAFRRDVLQELIDQRLVLEVAAREGIGLDAADELEVEALIAQDILDHNNRARFLADLRAIGFTEADYAERLRAGILSQKTTARVLFDDPFIQPRDLREYYDQNQHLYAVDQKIVVRHLMLSAKVWPEAELSKRVARVQAELEQGASLEELVGELSDGPRKGSGGLWELKTPEDFIDPLGEKVFELEAGERSGLLESHLGFHFVEVIQRDRARTLAFSEVQTQIEQTVRKQLWTRRFHKWRDELRARAFISIYLDGG